MVISSLRKDATFSTNFFMMCMVYSNKVVQIVIPWCRHMLKLVDYPQDYFLVWVNKLGSNCNITEIKLI